MRWRATFADGSIVERVQYIMSPIRKRRGLLSLELHSNGAVFRADMIAGSISADGTLKGAMLLSHLADVRPLAFHVYNTEFGTGQILPKEPQRMWTGIGLEGRRPDGQYERLILAIQIDNTYKAEVHTSERRLLDGWMD